MPRSSKETHYSHPQLGLALRWLREHRSGMTRLEVAKSAQGGPSEPYLRKLENCERTSLAKEKLQALLSLYGSSLQELEALLAASVWTHDKASSYKPTSKTLDPSFYRDAAVSALKSISRAGTWSDMVEDPDAQKLLQGEATELVDHFVRLSPADRAELLNAVRSKRLGH